MKPTPILFVGDNPSLFGGLSRIGRDLATLACTLPEFRVGYLGRGDGNDRRFPFTLYPFPESGQWGKGYLKPTWENFSDGQPGIIMTLDDPSRRLWFADPVGLSPEMQDFLGPHRNFQKVGYFPLDSEGPMEGVLGVEARSALAGYDRILTASEWGCNVAKRSGFAGADWQPHGLFMDKFHPVPNAREMLNWKRGDIYVGCVMANQARKDFPVLFETARILKDELGGKFKLWLHTDTLIRYWNVYALATDYGVADCLQVTVEMNDEALALRYSACDATMLPSAGEGFGYPVAESLACGTACIVTDYAAGQELVETDCKVPPVTYRIDTSHNVKRAVLSGWGFASRVRTQAEKKREMQEFRSEELVASVAHLDWNKLREPWTKWFREGLR